MPENNSQQRENKFILIVMIIVFAIIAAIFVKTFYDAPEGTQVKIYVPVGLIAAFISFYYFREYNRVKRAKQEERREELNARRQELLDNVIKAKKKNEPGSDDDNNF